MEHKNRNADAYRNVAAYQGEAESIARDDRPEIFGILSDLADIVSAMEAVSGGLLNRLAPVLRQSTPTDTDACCAIQSSKYTMIGQDLSNIHRRCFELTAVLNDAVDRLEI